MCDTPRPSFQLDLEEVSAETICFRRLSRYRIHDCEMTFAVVEIYVIEVLVLPRVPLSLEEVFVDGVNEVHASACIVCRVCVRDSQSKLWAPVGLGMRLSEHPSHPQ